MDKQPDSQTSPEQASNRSNALVFISHDSRDADIAEAFSRLISSVSAGVLKSFRSSDKKGNQGIEYGIEWYPEIMKKLEAASDVVCLLTPHSMNRPWILFEAGVAKGKLNTPVQGVALGVPLSTAASGPFAQFQNLDDEVDSLTQLVIQLVGRIPGAEPDRDVVKMQVEAFKQKVQPMLDKQKSPRDQRSDGPQEETSVAKIFEEIKVMFQDLPSRIERRIDPESSINRKRIRRLHPMFMEEALHMSKRDLGENLGPLIIGSLFKDDFPWLYEVAAEVYRKLESDHPDAPDALRRFVKLVDRLIHHPMLREMRFGSRDGRFEMEEAILLNRHLLERTLNLADKASSKLNSDTNDKADHAG
ncbi:MAG: toll/interleukin-1 receptor domain-containing protein [Pseudomonadota bacterium]